MNANSTTYSVLFFLLYLVFYAYSPFGLDLWETNSIVFDFCNLQLYPPCKTLLEYLYGHTRKTASKSSLKREEYRRKQRARNLRKVCAVRTDSQRQKVHVLYSVDLLELLHSAVLRTRNYMLRLLVRDFTHSLTYRVRELSI